MHHDGQTRSNVGLRRRRASTSLAAAAAVAVLGVRSAFGFGEFPSKVPVPADNPMTPAKIALGKQLYFDPRISLSGTVSCNSCHDVAGNGTNNLPQSFGVFGRLDLPRTTPTVFNAAFNTVQFWDGRARSLEQQIEGPTTNPVEMGMPSHEAVANRVKRIAGYRAEFAEVFGGRDPITFDHVAKAIAAFERTLVTPNSPYDRYLKGDTAAMSTAAREGMKLFSSAGCDACHGGPMFDNPGLPMGTGWYRRFPMQPAYPLCAGFVRTYHLAGDLGRFGVTHDPADKAFFRVPGLRNVALTAPYFNYGTVQNLHDAVRVMGACQLGKTLTAAQVNELVAFLDSLTGQFPKITLPRLPQTRNTTLLMPVPELAKAAK